MRPLHSCSSRHVFQVMLSGRHLRVSFQLGPLSDKQREKLQVGPRPSLHASPEPEDGLHMQLQRFADAVADDPVPCPTLHTTGSMGNKHAGLGVTVCLPVSPTRNT